MYEHEQKLVGAILQDSSILADLPDIAPQHLYTEAGQEIFSWVLREVEANRTVDLANLIQERQDLQAPAVEAINACPSTYNARHYADSVLKGFRSRKLKEIGHDLANASDDPDAAIDNVMQNLLSLQQERQEWDVDLRGALKETVEELDRRFQRQQNGQPLGIPSGLRDLDGATGGYVPGDLIVVGARPSMGKTGWMLTGALAAARQGYRVGLISAEMDRVQLSTRLLAMDAAMDSARFRNLAGWKSEDWDSVMSSTGRLAQLPLYIYDKPAPTIGQTVSQIRKWAYRHNLDEVWVDYLQRIKTSGKEERRDLGVGEMARGLKTLAGELHVPVVSLAQVNRNVEQRTDKRPGMADLKDSGEIEQEADQILLLYRDEVYHANPENKGEAEVLLEKNRHGETGPLRASFSPEQTMFGDWTPYKDAY